ncbi:MAG TPA: EAL domain-containing protein [Burkholderiales bacterium]|nr:EAL domain-containing protein [Burkholderiales bacterium]
MGRPGFHSIIDAWIYALSVYGVPLVILAVTLTALFAWDSHYEARDSLALSLAALEDPKASLGPREAAAALRDAPRVTHQDTKLSEAPFWFAFRAEAMAQPGRIDVELPSRHARQVECWNGATLQPLGHADRTAASGHIRPAKAGFAIEFDSRDAPIPVLCRGTFAGPARISAVQWPDAQLEASIRDFHRNAGLLEGGLLVLSLFVLVTAMVNREWLYVLFATWLLASLRLGAISAGWDTQWLGRTIPPDWILTTRKITVAAYFTLTYALFARLFRDDLRRLGAGWPLALAQWSCLVVVVAALTLPYGRFLPVVWVSVGAGIAVIAFYLVRILHVTRSLVAMWYAASLGIVLVASFYEVIAAALGLKGLIGAVNNVTAALFSCLLAALAIAEQMRQERVERVQAQNELKSTYDALPIGLFTLAADGSFERANPALGAMLGIDPERAAKHHWREYFEAGSWDRLAELLRRAKGGEMEMRSAAASGEPRWYHVKTSLTGDKIEGSLQDVTERYRATERLKFLAQHDPLTGVLNRRGVEAVIEDAKAQAAQGRPLAVAYLDLDRFKLINDLFGHVAGDDVLQQVCRRIEGLLAEGSILGRIGGDEFLIVFRGAPIGAAAAICRAIVDAIGSVAFQTGDKAFQVKASIGLVDVTDRVPVKDAIAVADRACRVAKTGAHSGLVVYDRDASVFHERAQELKLVARLGSGDAPEGLFLMMQPILSVRAPYDSLTCEVLVRMRDPDGTITGGGPLMAAAENNGRAAVIDRWVLANTLGWLERHHAALAATRFVTMNLSGASLNDERFIQDAFAMLAECPRAAACLCIEITESVALHDLANTRRFVDRVRSCGAKVALDDFGAGYTSFSYLRGLPADALKIDGSLIVNVNAHPSNLAIVEAIVELARNLGMQTIAEWAEDCATVEALVQAGIDYVQGFVISRPQEPSALLSARSSAGFITDAEVLRYVRDTLAPAAALAQLDALGLPRQTKMH